ncbi:Mycobacterium numidiamassiliense ORFan [Mycobacterium numidiamassiliense]|uniref:Mycobacterium numidiamassiliense ORFan n=1 Tax=Mycobacterium numidiamassiliense TaxID=1841861 RepID=A0A2U3PHD4_9MYCO|nr:Mycobacterium numidiamassiliense ORFan [Mycobacterium numidiamassiliense]
MLQGIALSIAETGHRPVSVAAPTDHGTQSIQRTESGSIQ